MGQISDAHRLDTQPRVPAGIMTSARCVFAAVPKIRHRDHSAALELQASCGRLLNVGGATKNLSGNPEPHGDSRGCHNENQAGLPIGQLGGATKNLSGNPEPHGDSRGRHNENQGGLLIGQLGGATKNLSGNPEPHGDSRGCHNENQGDRPIG